MTADEIAAALLELAALRGTERSRAVRALKKEFAATAAAEDAAGMAEAVADGMTQEEVAAALGTTPGRVSLALKAHGLPGRKTGRRPGTDRREPADGDPLAALAARMRAEGRPWREIGPALGMSHEAARKKYGNPSPATS